MKPAAVLGLVGLSLLGVASLLASDLDLGAIAGQTGLAPEHLRWLILVQPAVLSFVAVVVGWRTSPRTGFRAPLLDGGLARLRAGGLVVSGGVAVVGSAALGLYTWLTSQEFVLEGASVVSTSLTTRLLYGGITEEVLLRWGLMGGIAWLLIRIVRRPDGETGDLIVVANVAAAILFALGHVPALALIPGAAPVHYLTSFLVNASVGVLYGWTFSEYGLEYAMLGHAGTHLLLFAGVGLLS